jgi:hypothetical protein
VEGVEQLRPSSWACENMKQKLQETLQFYPKFIVKNMAALKIFRNLNQTISEYRSACSTGIHYGFCEKMSQSMREFILMAFMDVEFRVIRIFGNE